MRKSVFIKSTMRRARSKNVRSTRAYGRGSTRTARQAKELLAARDNINAVVDSLAEPYRTVLYLRFIEGHTVEKTAEIMFYSYRWLMRLQATAIQEFRKAVNK